MQHFLVGYISGTKLVLPEGFERKDDNVKEEVVIPKNDPAPPDVGSNLIPITTLDKVAIFLASLVHCAISFSEKTLIALYIVLETNIGSLKKRYILGAIIEGSLHYIF